METKSFQGKLVAALFAGRKKDVFFYYYVFQTLDEIVICIFAKTDKNRLLVQGETYIVEVVKKEGNKYYTFKSATKKNE